MCMVACLQVGYCQGMAFVAGIILMYLPEEPAYRSALLCSALWSAQVAPWACAIRGAFCPWHYLLNAVAQSAHSGPAFQESHLLTA